MSDGISTIEPQDPLDLTYRFRIIAQVSEKFLNSDQTFTHIVYHWGDEIEVHYSEPRYREVIKHWITVSMNDFEDEYKKVSQSRRLINLDNGDYYVLHT
jgi:inhibitor of KinA sporulation pathway (predicted exonuclease)